VNSEHQHYTDWIGATLAEYEGPLLRYAVRFTGDLHRARDIVQDTFLRLCRQRRDEVEPYLRPWLFKVCRNRALEILRHERRAQPFEPTDTAQPTDTAASPADVAETQDSTRRVLQLIGSLPARQQEVLRLKFQEELSYKEISDVTGLTVTNVGFIIHTAVRTLRERLLRDDDPPQGSEATS